MHILLFTALVVFVMLMIPVGMGVVMRQRPRISEDRCNMDNMSEDAEQQADTTDSPDQRGWGNNHNTVSMVAGLALVLGM